MQVAGAAGWKTQPLGEVSDAARLAWCINQQTAGNTPEEHSIQQQFATGPDSKDVRREEIGWRTAEPWLQVFPASPVYSRLQGARRKTGPWSWSRRSPGYASAGLMTFPEQHGNLL